jgi:hypothetical protein
MTQCYSFYFHFVLLVKEVGKKTVAARKMAKNTKTSQIQQKKRSPGMCYQRAFEHVAMNSRNFAPGFRTNIPARKATHE